MGVIPESVSWRCLNLPRSGRLQKARVDSPTVLEAGSPKSRCPQGRAPSGGSGGGGFLPLPASGGSSVSRIVAASLQPLPHLLCVPICMSLCLKPPLFSYKDASQWI